MLCQLASGQCFSVRSDAETGFKGFDRKNKCSGWELNSSAFHGFLVKFKGFWQAEMSSQQLYAQGMLKKEFPGSKFIHLPIILPL